MRGFVSHRIAQVLAAQRSHAATALPCQEPDVEIVRQLGLLGCHEQGFAVRGKWTEHSQSGVGCLPVGRLPGVADRRVGGPPGQGVDDPGVVL